MKSIWKNDVEERDGWAMFSAFKLTPQGVGGQHEDSHAYGFLNISFYNVFVTIL